MLNNSFNNLKKKVAKIQELYSFCGNNLVKHCRCHNKMYFCTELSTP